MLISETPDASQPQPASLVLLHIADDEPQVRRDQALSRLLVAGTSPVRQRALLGRILDQGILLNVVQVLVERVEGP